MKFKNSREIGHNLSIVLDAKQNIVFRRQEDVFKLLKVKKDSNQHAFYPIEHTCFALWFPILSGKPEKCNNYINVYGDEIEEKPIGTKTKNKESSIYRGWYRIVFGKYNAGLRFVGVFVDDRRKGNKNFYKKISDVIILNPK